MAVISTSTKRRKHAKYSREGKQFVGPISHFKQVVETFIVGKNKKGKDLLYSYTKHIPIY